MLCEVDGKEGLVDLGGDGGAPEIIILSHKGSIQGEMDVEDEKRGRGVCMLGIVDKQPTNSFCCLGAVAQVEDACSH